MGDVETAAEADIVVTKALATETSCVAVPVRGLPNSRPKPLLTSCEGTISPTMRQLYRPL